MKDESKHLFSNKTIEEYYSQKKNRVVWHWRWAGTEKWHHVLTPYDRIPWVEIPEQFNDKSGFYENP
jgi:hypothetical protein